MPAKNKKLPPQEERSTPRLPLKASAMLLSRREVTVSGCRRITEYGSARIRLAVCEGTVTVEGRGLTVHTYRGDELTVRGWLTSITFEDAVHSTEIDREKGCSGKLC